MNGKFVRLFKEELIQKLLLDIDETFQPSDYVLGIPKANYNPLTRLLGNTYIKLVSRNPVPLLKSIGTYYDRSELAFAVPNKDISKQVDVGDNVHLYDILDQINSVCSLALKEDDVYNTTVKEFPNGKFYVVILAKPESYSYTGKIELEVNVKPLDTDPHSVVLDAEIVDRSTATQLVLETFIVDTL